MPWRWLLRSLFETARCKERSGMTPSGHSSFRSATVLTPRPQCPWAAPCSGQSTVGLLGMSPFWPTQDFSHGHLVLWGSPLAWPRLAQRCCTSCQLLTSLLRIDPSVSALRSTVTDSERCLLYREMLTFASRGCWRGHFRRKGVVPFWFWAVLVVSSV